MSNVNSMLNVSDKVKKEEKKWDRNII